MGVVADNTVTILTREAQELGRHASVPIDTGPDQRAETVTNIRE